MLRKAALLFVVGAIIGTGVPAYGSELVKQSSSGICHSADSPYYSRTQTFTSYPSLEACVSQGGRLRDGASLKPTSLTGHSYEREAFGHAWSDSDGDCQNARTEALIAQSSSAVRFYSNDQCRVTHGRWVSPFTGNVIVDAGLIDIDHVVPLKWAWERGARQWSSEKREKFANDPINLLSVEASLNRSKGAKGPDEWLPPSGQCGYISRFIRVMKIYGLTPSQSESPSFNRLREAC